jgi:uncharacterized phage protein gp47/JayE
MYEHITYEDILQRMLDKIPNNMDKREGSIIYDALAPAAIELQLMYLELDVIMNESFADTASREYLIRRANERGIVPERATKAILKGVFTPATIDVLGKRFNCGELNYIAIEKIADGEYKLQCETEGLDGNANFGQMIPIEYVEGLETAELTEILIPGEDEEDTEVFRQRYFKSFESQAFGGNIADYKQKTNAIDGVGSTKVTPVWNGGGTVLLTIINSNFEAASEELIQSVQEVIDPTQDASGKGLAPIGHIVTVRTAEEVSVNVTTSITYDSNYSFDALKTQIEEVIKNYLSELRKTWGDNENLIVRSSQIDARLLDIVGIVDIQNTYVNSVKNFTVSEHQIPVMGSVIDSD